MVAFGSGVDLTGSICLKSPKANTGIPPKSEHRVDPLILIAATPIQAILTVAVPSSSAISEM
eukprot:1467444-Ditylum_brightwellii.AAC.1